MWDDYENTQVEFEQTPSRRWRIGMFLIAVLVVLGMLGSAIAGLSWLFTRRAATPTPDGSRIAMDAESAVSPHASGTEQALPDLSPLPTPVATSSLPAVDRIVYVNTRGQIGTITPHGTEERLLTSDSRRYQFPAWSPDGRQVAAIAASRAAAGVYVIADDEEQEPVAVYTSSSEPPFYLYWSPDGEQISFLANHPDAPMALHLASAAGDGSRLVTTGGPFYWNWSADGKQMLIHTGFTGDGARLALLNTETDVIGDNIAPPGYFQAPGISADGRFLAYAEAAGGVSRIVVADSAGGSRFEARHNGIAALTWSPAANKLAFISSAEAGASGFVGPLRVMDAQTGEVMLLSRERVLSFFWSPDGRSIAYLNLTSRSNNDITAGLSPAVVSVKNRPPARLAQQRNLPTFDLVLMDVESGNGRVLLSNFQLSVPFITQFLPFFDQYALSHRLWSPDSDALVLPVVEDGANRIVVIPASGGPKRTLADGAMAFWSPQ